MARSQFYSLSFGDGHSTSFMTTPTASHAYATGTFTATLYVQDNGGAVGRPDHDRHRHQYFADRDVHGTRATALTCGFDASGTADPDGSIHSYLWTFSDGSGGQRRHDDSPVPRRGHLRCDADCLRQQRREDGREPTLISQQPFRRSPRSPRRAALSRAPSTAPDPRSRWRGHGLLMGIWRRDDGIRRDRDARV